MFFDFITPRLILRLFVHGFPLRYPDKINFTFQEANRDIMINSWVLIINIITNTLETLFFLEYVKSNFSRVMQIDNRLIYLCRWIDKFNLLCSTLAFQQSINVSILNIHCEIIFFLLYIENASELMKIFVMPTRFVFLYLKVEYASGLCTTIV